MSVAKPTASSTKADIMAYLDSREIGYSASSNKSELLALLGGE